MEYIKDVTNRDDDYVALISDDQKTLSCLNQNGKLVWTRKFLTANEWQDFASLDRAGNIELGQFLYVAGTIQENFIVVYSPLGGLDMNVSFSIYDGTVNGIWETR